MGLSLKLDRSIGMCRSVGDWPNGVVILDMSNPCQPSWAVDWKFPVKPVEEMAEQIDESGKVYIEIPAPMVDESEHLERISNEDAIVGCDSIEEAMALWSMTCHICSDLAQRSADDPTTSHEFFHMTQFALELFTVITDESDRRGPDGKHLDE